MGIARLYLTAYNGLQLSLWGLALVRCVLHLAKGGKVAELYAVCRTLVRAGLAGAMLEILHAYVKLVKSPVATTAAQCIVRAFVIVGAVEAEPTANVGQTVWCGQMVLAWAVSESIRYGYYLSNLLTNGKGTPRWLTWLRYSAFLALYPLGIVGEMGCLKSAIPALERTGRFSVALPNKANFAFSYPSAIWFSLGCLYPLGGWSLYSYMLGQRRKQLRAA